jgi:hypothetical protein
MIDADIVVIPSGFRKKLTELLSPCPICVIGGATKIPRGPIVDTMELPVGTRFHLDFSFYSCVSIRGFKSLLTITDLLQAENGVFLRSPSGPHWQLYLTSLEQLHEQTTHTQGCVLMKEVNLQGPNPL